ncbi:MAG: cadherin repeat domain-containing protein, partial [Psychrobium sp.]|nr:cadherin repeat domain-containing protein [Psychrobium sp.]
DMGAVDSDGDAVTYELLDDNNGAFAIDSVTGIVTVLDSSQLTEGSVTISVRATSSDGSTNEQDVDITIGAATGTTGNTTNAVGDVTDIDEDDSNVVANNAIDGAYTGITAQATDLDGDVVSYTLSDNANGLFAIDSVTGVVTVISGAALGNEDDVYNVTVVAQSEDGSTSNETFTITLGGDAPSNPGGTPASSTSSIGALTDTDGGANNVAVDAVDGSYFNVDMGAVDSDGDAVTYELLDDNNGAFAIDSVTGIVTVLDSSQLTEGSVTISVRATSSDGSTNEQDVDITIGAATGTTGNTTNAVGDVTDIDEDDSNVVANNAIDGAYTGITAQATDLDGDVVSYTLSDNANGLFAIDSVTGVVTVISGAALGNEDDVYNVTVVAQSVDGSTSNETFTITLGGDAPSNPGGTPASSTSSIGALTDTDGGANNVAVDAVDGSYFNVDMGAVDSDGDAVTYELLDDNNGAFAIDSVTGIVTVLDSSQLTEGSVTISVRATSSDGSTNEQDVDITIGAATGTTGNTTNAVGDVTDIDEDDSNVVANNAIDGAYTGITAQATDLDGDVVSYTLSDNANGLFAIDSVTGVVTVISGAALGNEDDVYNVTVVAQSEDGSTSNETFTITLGGDAPSNPGGTPAPSSTSAIGALTDTDGLSNDIAANAEVDTYVNVDMDAVDNDGDVVTYELLDDANGAFRIDSTTGRVLVNDNTQMAENTPLDIVVRATSSDGSTNESTVTINVGADRPPVDVSIAFEALSGTVTEGEDITVVVSLVGDLTADNAFDFSLNGVDLNVDLGTLIYSDNVTFNSITGQLNVPSGVASFTITIPTINDNTIETTETLSISVDGHVIDATILDNNSNNSLGLVDDIDLDDSNVIAANVVTGAYTGITANAVDSNVLNSVTYSLIDDAQGRFDIDATTGKVTVQDASQIGILDDSYQITVRATSSNSFFTEQVLTVTVGGDAPSPVGNPTYALGALSDSDDAINLVEVDAVNDTYVGLDVSAIDVDGDAVSYELIDDASGLFKIDSTTGQVSINDNSLLVEGNQTVVVRATSSDGSTNEAEYIISIYSGAVVDIGIEGITSAGVKLTSNDDEITLTGAVIYTIDGGLGDDIINLNMSREAWDNNVNGIQALVVNF